MTMESLQRVAEAAGFAMVADDDSGSEFVTRPSKSWPALDFNKAVAVMASAQAVVAEPLTHWTRSSLNSLLPMWAAKA